MKLKTYFEIANTNYRQMALELKVDASTVHKYMTGDRTPSLEMALKIEDLTEGDVSVRDWGYSDRNNTQTLSTEG